MMTITEALDILQQNEDMEMQKGEILAELGSSAFCGGAREPGDAMAIAHMIFENDYRNEEYEREWAAKLREAKNVVEFYESIAPEADHVFL